MKQQNIFNGLCLLLMINPERASRWIFVYTAINSRHNKCHGWRRRGIIRIVKSSPSPAARKKKFIFSRVSCWQRTWRASIKPFKFNAKMVIPDFVSPQEFHLFDVSLAIIPTFTSKLVSYLSRAHRNEKVTIPRILLLSENDPHTTRTSSTAKGWVRLVFVITYNIPFVDKSTSPY